MRGKKRKGRRICQYDVIKTSLSWTLKSFLSKQMTVLILPIMQLALKPIKCVSAFANDKTPIDPTITLEQPCVTNWLRPIQSCNLRKGKGLQNKIVEALVLWNRQLCGKAEQTRTYETSGGKDDIVVIHNKMEQGAIIWFSDLQIFPLLVMNFKIYFIGWTVHITLCLKLLSKIYYINSVFL